ncbi:PspA-associated protein PspAA [Calderihabitans maritimus]|uniref:PspA-associated domain-containing protein n=1 Tax=Calderihabitans maritimus TaxID=1246530 RepID=A0A1Z5HS26_9FIRM|nr:hypothetical protein [Calderihabitans maritimus]GAW92326.1 hypothetical protein Tph_c03890 [Calderihabitans maritimus]
MIIRIQGEGQYELSGEDLKELDRIDNEMLGAVEDGDEERFRATFSAVLSLIRGKGRKLPDTELKESDLIIPPADITLEEAREMFTEYPRELQKE